MPSTTHPIVPARFYMWNLFGITDGLQEDVDLCLIIDDDEDDDVYNDSQIITHGLEEDVDNCNFINNSLSV